MALCRIPFTYTSAGVLKRHRSVEPWIFGAWTEAEIPDVSEDDAPVSMTWHERARTREPKLHATRWHDGRNWRPADPGTPYTGPVPFVAEDFGQLPRLETDHLRRRSGFSHVAFLASATGQDFYDLRSFLLGGELPAGGMGEFRELLHCGRQEAEEAVLRRCRDLLFIDGQLWRAGPEPRYAAPVGASTEPSFPEPSVQVVTAPAEARRRVQSVGFFRADRPDDAADFVRDMARGTVDEVPVERIEVLLPEAVTFDDEADGMLRAGQQAADSAAGSLRHAPAGAVMAWVALRDRLAGGGPPDEVRDLLADVAAAFPCNPDVERTADVALRRWDMRPLDISLRP